MSHPDYPLRTTSQKFVKVLALLNLYGQEAERLLNAYGSSCTSLYVSNMGFIPDVWPCTELKSLTMNIEGYCPLGPFLAAQSSLEKLEVACGWHGYAVRVMHDAAQYGAGIKYRNISGISWIQGEAIARLLEVTGNSLFSLKLATPPGHVYESVGSDVPSFFKIKSIFGLCPLVTELGVYPILHPDLDFVECVVDLYCSYGQQLKKIDSCVQQFVPADMLQSIAKHCPNASIDVLLEDLDPTNVLGILGPQIHSLELGPYFQLAHPDVVKVSLSTRCSEVKTLRIGMQGADVFFVQPRPSLKILNLSLGGRMSTCQRALAHAVEKTGGLRMLHLHCPRPLREDLELMADGNKNLDTVVVYLEETPPVDVEAVWSSFMIDVIESFARCQLQEMLTLFVKRNVFPKIPAIEDACVRLRNRRKGVSVRMGHTTYLP